jgi:hypothetical protein
MGGVEVPSGDTSYAYACARGGASGRSEALIGFSVQLWGWVRWFTDTSEAALIASVLPGHPLKSVSAEGA